MKVFLIFSQEKPTFLIFRKPSFSFISGNVYSDPWHNGTFLIFQESLSPKTKKKPPRKNFLYFEETEISSSKLKKLLISQEGT